MKNPQKGFIGLLLLVVVAILLVGGVVYVYIQKKQMNQPATENIGNQATSTIQTTSVSQNSSGEILLGDRAHYENLSTEGKGILESYNSLVRMNENLITGCILKYYDSLRALVGCSTVKPVLSLFLVDRKDFGNVGENNGYIQISAEGGYIESNRYVISVEPNEIFYYKVGDSTTSSVPNSKLANGETYVKSCDASGCNSTASFVGLTKTLMVLVYKVTQNNFNPEIRTVQFVLP